MNSSLLLVFGRRSGLLPKIVLIAGFSYLFIPIDLIPDKTPYIGHLDEFGFIMTGILLSRSLSIIALSRKGLLDAPASIWWPDLRQGRSWGTRIVRVLARNALSLGFAPIVLRLILGRRASPAECIQFRTGIRASSHGLPPLLRAAAYVPAASSLLGRTLLLSRKRAAEGNRGGDDPAHSLSGAQTMGDPLRIWYGPKVRFLHFEKTAGSSLTTFLTSLFHPLQIDPDPDRSHPPHERLAFPQKTMVSQTAARLVWGHYDLPALRRLDGDDPCFRMTLFREPKVRILSLYYYWRANASDEAATVRCARAHGLLEFLRLEDPWMRNYTENLYVRRLTGSYASACGDPLRSAPDATLALALQALDAFDFVGLAECLGESLALLGGRLGFEPPTHTPRVNVLVNSERNPTLPYRPIPRQAITHSIERELDRLTCLDRIIYEHARRRFEAARGT